jgi:hypothetical protein
VLEEREGLVDVLEAPEPDTTGGVAPDLTLALEKPPRKSPTTVDAKQLWMMSERDDRVAVLLATTMRRNPAACDSKRKRLGVGLGGSRSGGGIRSPRHSPVLHTSLLRSDRALPGGPHSTGGIQSLSGLDLASTRQ